MKKREGKLDYLVHPISKAEAISFVQQTHYSPVMPRLTRHFLGFHLEGRLVGVLTLGYGTQPLATAKKLFGKQSTTDIYFEIGKMAMLDELKTNAESQMIKATVKWIKANCPECQFLYTMADGAMGKVGYVYQGANFFYGGKFETPVFCTPSMEKVHIRTMRPQLLENFEMLENKNPDHPLVRSFYEGKRKQKHLCWPTVDYLESTGWKWYKAYMYRYLFPITKRARKFLVNSEDWSLGNYPKDDDLEFKQKKLVDGKGVFVAVKQPKFDLSLENISVNKKNVNQ